MSHQSLCTVTTIATASSDRAGSSVPPNLDRSEASRNTCKVCNLATGAFYPPKVEADSRKGESCHKKQPASTELQSLLVKHSIQVFQLCTYALDLIGNLPCHQSCPGISDILVSIRSRKHTICIQKLKIFVSREFATRRMFPEVM